MRTVDLELFLSESSIELRTLEQWVERRWIVPTEDGTQLQLTEVDAARAVFIRDLRGDLGVNEEGVDVVLHLLDQMHGLRRAVQALRAELGRGPADDSDED